MTTPKVGLNYVSKNRGKLVIPALSNTTFNMRDFDLPGIDLPPVLTPSPFYDKKLYGDKVEFEPLVCTFLVDEEISNWLEIFNWMIGLGAPEDKVQYRERTLTELDAYITIYSSHNNPIHRIRFLECTPVALSGVTFEEGISETTTIEATLTMEYLRYEFVPLGE